MCRYVNRLPIGEQLFNFCVICNVAFRQNTVSYQTDILATFLVSYYQTALHAMKNGLGVQPMKLSINLE